MTGVILLVLGIAAGGPSDEPDAQPSPPKRAAPDDSDSDSPAITRLRELGAEFSQFGREQGKAKFAGARQWVTLKGNVIATTISTITVAGKTLKGQREWVRRGEPAWKGTDVDLALLADIGAIFRLEIGGISLTEKGMAQIGRLEEVDYLTMTHTDITDAALAELKNLESLKGLELRACLKVTDKGLAGIAELPGLSSLWLPDGNFTDAGMAHVGKIASLEQLSLRDSRISDKGVAELRDLNGLVSLDLHETDVTDKGMTHLSVLERLRELNLTGTKVGDAGIEQLAKLPELASLTLDSTQVTNKCAAHLAKLNLTSLKLGETELDDGAIRELCKLENLRAIRLPHRVTKAGLVQLHEALPECTITYDVVKSVGGFRRLTICLYPDSDEPE
jgi:hypothetical protein